MEERTHQPWDDSMRNLVRADPQAFITWLLGDAVFVRELPHKLKSWKLEMDALLLARLPTGEEVLVEIEFQTYHDSTIRERLLRYHVWARSEYHLPVLSCIIYLLKDGHLPSSPLEWTVPLQGEVKALDFYFGCIRIADLTPEELLHLGQPGLLPLLPLTKRGANREVATTMFTKLEAAGREDLASIGATLASLIFSKTNPIELDWLNRRLHDMTSILRESPLFQQILQEGREEGREEALKGREEWLEKGLEEGIEKGLEKGREEGLEKGLQQGKLEGLRQVLLHIVQARFPKLARLTKAFAASTQDPEMLQSLILNMSLAQTFEEAQATLLEGSQEDGK